MKRSLLFFVFVFIIVYNNSNAQEKKLESFLKELSEKGCLCIDSIQTYNKSNSSVTLEISNCIKKQTSVYQLGVKLLEINELKDLKPNDIEKKEVNVNVNLNENSVQYKKCYYELERYMMDNCKSLKEKIRNNENQSDKSFSDNEKASEFYSKGLKESKQENYEKAIGYFEQAVKVDPEFAFAWDNLGYCYRRLNNFDKAIESYKKSIEIDPNGLMPLQNIAVAYLYKKDYENAIKSYEKLAEIDPKNPEVFYGIGNLYSNYLNEHEKGLSYMCKAYNRYAELNSPYRTDAEKIISLIYSEMKKQDKLERFNQILKENNIRQDD